MLHPCTAHKATWKRAMCPSSLALLLKIIRCITFQTTATVTHIKSPKGALGNKMLRHQTSPAISKLIIFCPQVGCADSASSCYMTMRSSSIKNFRVNSFAFSTLFLLLYPNTAEKLTPPLQYSSDSYLPNTLLSTPSL